MKKTALVVVSFVFLCGCGSGGGGTTSSSLGGGGTSAATTNTVTLNIVNGGASSLAALGQRILYQVGINTPPANSVRVIFRNISTTTTCVPDVDDNGVPTGTCTNVTAATEFYKKVIDKAYTGASVSVAVPPAPNPTRGYVVDVLTSYEDTANAPGYYQMLDYGRNNSIKVPDTGGQSVSVYPVAPLVTVTPVNPVPGSPDAVYSEDKYTVTAALINGPADFSPLLRFNYKVRQDLNNVDFFSFSAYSTHLAQSTLGLPRAFTAPSSLTDGTIYMPQEFFINDAMLDTTKSKVDNFKIELSSRWIAVAPKTIPMIGISSITLP